jgi:hypothetical protein
MGDVVSAFVVILMIGFGIGGGLRLLRGAKRLI